MMTQQRRLRRKPETVIDHAALAVNNRWAVADDPAVIMISTVERARHVLADVDGDVRIAFKVKGQDGSELTLYGFIDRSELRPGKFKSGNLTVVLDHPDLLSVADFKLKS